MQSTDFGVAHFYYSKTVPGDAVGIASIQASEIKPSDLCSINGIPLTSQQGASALTVTPLSAGGAVVTAPGLGRTVSFTGATTYQIDNQFFELTTRTSADGKPLYYIHKFAGAHVTSAQFFDVDMNPIDATYIIENSTVLHSMDGRPYWVEYYVNGQVQTELLRYDPILTRLVFAPNNMSYVLTPGGGLTVFSSATTYYIRFLQHNGYQLLAPYNVPLNDPWYPRVRFNLKPIAQEWGRMLFSPVRPYLPASWVPGAVLASNLIEFERKNLYWDGHTYPDVLVYDKNYNLKFALDGTAVSAPVDKGYLFPWMRSQFVDIDSLHARVVVNVQLEPTDLCFAFYSYWERDVIYTDLDVNPFVNDSLKDKTIRFYFAVRAANPFKNVYYEVIDEDGTLAFDADNAAMTNDPVAIASGVSSSATGGAQLFGSMVVGWSVAPADFTFEDIRVRGGGLAPVHQGIPQANHFWDLGYLDGRPYPTGGALPVYLPETLLALMTRDEIAAKLQAIVPAGVLPLVRYYNPLGEESL
jgi:hypothetical protein